LNDEGNEGEVTVLLKQLAGGNPQALGELVPMVYEQLHAIAQRQLAGEAAGHTLNATALVNEAYLRIARLNRVDWQDRQHFFAIASQAIRRVLVDYAVRRNAAKRDGKRKRVEVLQERQVRVVECRFFGDMSIEETALALGISKATVKRDWVPARAWLNRELSDG